MLTSFLIGQKKKIRALAKDFILNTSAGCSETSGDEQVLKLISLWRDDVICATAYSLFNKPPENIYESFYHNHYSKFSKIWKRSFVEDEPDWALHFIHTHKYCISNFYIFDICSRVI